MKPTQLIDRGMESGDVAVADEWLGILADHIKIPAGEKSRRMAPKPPRRQKIPAMSLREKASLRSEARWASAPAM